MRSLTRNPNTRFMGSRTPGVLKRKLKVTKNMPLAPRLGS
jgi:hypothetical protein